MNSHSEPRPVLKLLSFFCIILASLPIGRLKGSPENATSDARLIEALKSLIPHVLRLNQTPGLNIALARHGKVIWEEGFGYADLGRKTPMTPDTVLHSGSMCKTYTGTAVMQLVEKGIIGLYDSINKYIKDFKIINPLGEREITFFDLLTHRSGLSSNNAGSDFKAPKPLGVHLKEDYGKPMFENYSGTLLPRWSAKAGEKFQYSNFGLATLGYLVEVTNPEGLSFSDYVQKHIIDPLGMKSSQYVPVQDKEHVRPDIFARFSKGYAHFGPVLIPTPTIYFADYPAGTVVTTPGDHIRLLLAFLNKGNFNGYQLLKPETVDLMLTPQTEWPEFGVKIGMIWMLRNVGKEDFNFGHAGAHMFGWTNEFRAFPQQDFAYVVAMNRWPMTYERYRESILIANFISAWIKNEKLDSHRILPAKSWAWKTSYVIGLIMAENLKGALGIESPVTDPMIEAMAKGAQVRTEAENGVSVWDSQGFRTGIKDMLSIEMTVPALKAFLKSNRLQIAPEELEIIYRELGGTGLPFFYLNE